MTPNQLHAMTDDELALEAAKVLTPGKKGEHDWKYFDDKEWAWNCLKCGATFKEDVDCDNDCPVPDPIKLDWNTAMEWRDKIVKLNGEDVFWCELENVMYQAESRDGSDVRMVTVSRPRDYLEAACLAAESGKK